jgi:hypothetical protein
MPYKLSEQELTAFRNDGFVAINRLIPDHEIARLHGLLLELHQRQVGFKEGALFDAVGLDDGIEPPRFPQIMMPRSFAPELAKSDFFDVGLALAKQLIGETARIKADIAFYKPAHIGSQTPWHQDEAFGDAKSDYDEVTIWLAITPANADNSCMSFVPGSHLGPLLEHRPLGGDPRIHALECIADFGRQNVIEMPLQPGGCTIHHRRTLHYAGANTSDQMRIGYALIFDTVPVPRFQPYDFIWHRGRNTARASRERRWRLRGGILVYAWRQRGRLRINRLFTDLRKLGNAAFKLVGAR